VKPSRINALKDMFAKGACSLILPTGTGSGVGGVTPVRRPRGIA